MTPLRSLTLALAAMTTAAFGQKYQLVENFSAPLPDGTQIISEPDLKEPKVGLASAKVAYRINPKTRQPAGPSLPP